MTDLHCHILPRMDDGSRNVATSIDLLEMLRDQGVHNVAFTSHFLPEEVALEDFLRWREEAYQEILDGVPEELLSEFNFKLGAEVLYSEKLLSMDLRPLCITDTDYLLFELPFFDKPEELDKVIAHIVSQGITPVFAHVERYAYAMADLTMVYDWVKSGFLMQTNSVTLARRDEMSKFVLKLIEWDLVQIISSDTHNINKRPPHMDEAYAYVKDELGSSVAEKISLCGDSVFEGKKVVTTPYCPKKHFGKWK